MTVDMDKELLFIQITKSIKENGLIIKSMAWPNSLILMGVFIKENLRMVGRLENVV